MKLKDNIYKAIVTVSGIGYIPVASGTFAALAALGVIYVTEFYKYSNHFAFLLIFIGMIFALLFIGSIISNHSRRLFGSDDSRKIVIDEVLGFLVSCAFLDLDLQTMLIAFVLFRFFDIIKPFPIKYFDKKFNNGFGIMFDDVLAGIAANIACRIILLII